MPPADKKNKKPEETVQVLNGVFVFPNGDRYEGEYTLIDGVIERNGRGVHTTTEGVRLIGEWKTDKMTGQGRLEHPSGSYYEGEFSNNQFHGIGKYVWPDLSAYEGQFVENRIEGKGEYIDREGQIWSSGNFHYKNTLGLLFKHRN